MTMAHVVLRRLDDFLEPGDQFGTTCCMYRILYHVLSYVLYMYVYIEIYTYIIGVCIYIYIYIHTLYIRYSEPTQPDPGRMRAFRN